MSSIVNINPTKPITRETLKVVCAHARQSVALVLALRDFLDAPLNAAQKIRAKSASASVGAQMLRLKNALPSDPAKLRMYVESVKQKTVSIVASLPTDKTFATHTTRAAILREAEKVLANCAQFVEEYTEAKQNATVVAKVA